MKMPNMKQQGFTLISVMAGVAIFAFGTLALATGYIRVSAAMADNQSFTNAGVLAESLHAALSASPALVTTMVGYNAATYTNIDAVGDWTNQLKAALPAATATATAIDSAGVNCTTTPCVVTLTVGWTKGIAHSQIYVMQIGY